MGFFLTDLGLCLVDGRRIVGIAVDDAACQELTPRAGCRIAPRVDIDDHKGYEALLTKCDEQSVVVVENISRNWARWHEMERDTRCGTTFDLYYCGIIFYDLGRAKHNYRINF